GRDEAADPSQGVSRRARLALCQARGADTALDGAGTLFERGGPRLLPPFPGGRYFPADFPGHRPLSSRGRSFDCDIAGGSAPTACSPAGRLFRHIGRRGLISSTRCLSYSGLVKSLCMDRAPAVTACSRFDPGYSKEVRFPCGEKLVGSSLSCGWPSRVTR